MNVAIDLHHLLLEHAGTRRITINLIDQLRRMKKIHLLELTPSYCLRTGRNVLGKMRLHLFRFFWVQVHLPLLCLVKKVDILVSPEFNTPLFAFCKRIVIVPDAHMRAQKEFANPIWFYIYYVPFIEKAIQRADQIYTISEFAKEQIVQLMHVDRNKVRVVYLGVDPRFLAHGQINGQTNELSQIGLHAKEYILFVGTFEARKNIERLIESFSNFKTKWRGKVANVKLAIVGKPSSSMLSDRSKHIADLIDRLHLKNDVVLCGFVSDDLLPSLYRGAFMLAFPSLHEGFGFPIVEGFASGVPVMTSNLCSMPEIAGNAALLVDPYDVDDITEKIEMIYFDHQLRKRMIDAGLARVEMFTWELYAKKIISHLSERRNTRKG